MSTNRTWIVIFFLMAVLLCDLGCQIKTANESADKHEAPSPCQAMIKRSYPASKLGEGEIRIRAEVINLPQGVYEALDAGLRGQIEGSHPISQETLDRFYADSKGRLLFSPTIIMMNKDIGSFNISHAKVPDFKLDLIPILQTDGSLDLYTFAMISQWDRQLELGTIRNRRVVHPAQGSYEVYRGLKQGNDDVFLFIEVLTANATEKKTSETPT